MTWLVTILRVYRKGPPGGGDGVPSVRIRQTRVMCPVQYNRVDCGLTSALFLSNIYMDPPSYPTPILPAGLPVPVDDGACAHLENATILSTVLRSTSGSTVDVSELKGLTIIFCYPRTGAPNEIVPREWDLIPGARGCTPQACSFRDSFRELVALGVNQIFGLSVQDGPYHDEVKERLHLPYDLLSDKELTFAKTLNLPTFDWEGRKLIKRVTLAVRDNRIVKVWYPVFPSNQSAVQVVDWLKGEKKN